MKNTIRIAALALLAFSAACSKSDKGGITPPPDDTTVTPPPPPPPPPPADTDTVVTPPPQGNGVTLVTAGNIARCRSTDPGLTSNGNADLTANLIDSMPGATVLTLGNAANPIGNAANYNGCYAATWGRFLGNTYAVIGNHDYDSTNGNSPNDFFTYFGSRVPGAGGYYSFNLNGWHIIALNNVDPAGAAFYATGSAQRDFLTADLAANASAKCTIVAMHGTRFYSGKTVATDLSSMRGLWTDFMAAGVDVVLGAGVYQYERMIPLNADGHGDAAIGIRQFNVGMGGESANSIPPGGIHGGSAKLLTAFGVLKLTLKATTYDWAYIGTDGAVLDSGTGSCH